MKEALDSRDLSIHQGYNITRQVRELRRAAGGGRGPGGGAGKGEKEIRQGDEDSAAGTRSRGCSAKRLKKPSC